MAAPRVAPYGEWDSPVTSELITSASVRLAPPLLDAARGEVYWVEGRPAEGGRCVLCSAPCGGGGGAPVDASPASLNVRSRVHEYGGGEALVHDGVAYVSNFSDQRLYRIQLATGAAAPLTPEEGGWRFADACLDAPRGRLIAVAERHGVQAGALPENCLVAVPLGGGEPRVVASGRDFFAAPRLSPDGSRLAWLAWDLAGGMPWDACALYIADVAADGRVSAAPRCVAGGGGAEAVLQPRWAPDGSLHFLSDRSGFWNLYRLRGCDADVAEAESLCARAAEFGAPPWLLGASTYCCLPDGRLLCAFRAPGDAATTLALLPPGGGAPSALTTPFADVSGLCAAALPGGTRLRIALLGSRPDAPSVVAALDVPAGADVAAACGAPGAWRALRAAADVALEAGYVALPRAIAFPAAAAAPGDELSWLYYYPPTNKGFAPPSDSPPPPLLLRCHGGPTACASTAFNLAIQYWTSRGWAFADVDYGGSSGYGRAYRQRLAGRWGVVDVGDACAAAAALAAAGLADPARLCIDGGSAGGFTALAALTARPGVFAAGVSLYGICDLEALMSDTHKFESRYLDGLVGPYRTPADKELYRSRSPLHAAAAMTAPLALFQGTEDKVVPPNQARLMFDAVAAKGLPCALVLLEGEGHGFRSAANMRRALDGERAFLSRVLGIAGGDMPPDVAPIEIVNLAAAAP